MALIFYPHPEDANRGSLEERIDALMNAAENYRTTALDPTTKIMLPDTTGRGSAPKDLTVAFNWEEAACVLREIRELGEINKTDKLRKAALLAKLAEMYEMLRAAKMPKLEAVRLALISESNQLKGGNTTQVA